MVQSNIGRLDTVVVRLRPYKKDQNVFSANSHFYSFDKI